MGGVTATRQQKGPNFNNNNNNRKRQQQGKNWEARQGKSRRQFAKEVAGGSSTGPNKIESKQQQQPIKCSVCNQAENPKYKCPKCRDTYCSIQCCRDHKEKGCSDNKPINTIEECSSRDASEVVPKSKYLPQQEIDNLIKNSEASDSYPRKASKEDDDDDLEEGWKMTDSMREAMERSSWLKTELKDMGLRHIILNIDQASDLSRRHQSKTKQEEELDNAKIDYPRFKRFLDKLLVLTGVVERHGGNADMELDEWLEKETTDEESTQLILKPINRPPRIPPPLAKEIISDANKSASSDGDGDSQSDDDSSSTSSEDSSSDEDTK